MVPTSDGLLGLPRDRFLLYNKECAILGLRCRRYLRDWPQVTDQDAAVRALRDGLLTIRDASLSDCITHCPDRSRAVSQQG